MGTKRDGGPKGTACYVPKGHKGFLCENIVVRTTTSIVWRAVVGPFFPVLPITAPNEEQTNAGFSSQIEIGQCSWGY